MLYKITWTLFAVAEMKKMSVRRILVIKIS
jgi:hypothetical protein